MTVNAVSMRLKFTEFNDPVGVPDAEIEFAIEEAGRYVDNTWLPKDKDLGQMYLAAHYLMVWISRQESASGQQVKSEVIGRMSITYATPVQATDLSIDDLTTTP